MVVREREVDAPDLDAVEPRTEPQEHMGAGRRPDHGPIEQGADGRQVELYLALDGRRVEAHVLLRVAEIERETRRGDGHLAADARAVGAPSPTDTQARDGLTIGVVGTTDGDHAREDQVDAHDGLLGSCCADPPFAGNVPARRPAISGVSRLRTRRPTPDRHGALAVHPHAGSRPRVVDFGPHAGDRRVYGEALTEVPRLASGGPRRARSA